MAAEICSARAGLYKSWQCFRRMCAFSLFKNKEILPATLGASNPGLTSLQVCLL
jgi:hypothetical protein